MPGNWLIPSAVSFFLSALATIGLYIMYRIGHNRIVLGVVLPNLWLTVTFLLDALGLIDQPTRIAVLRAGQSLLEFAFIVGAVVFILKRRPA